MTTTETDTVVEMQSELTAELEHVFALQRVAVLELQADALDPLHHGVKAFHDHQAKLTFQTTS